MTTPPLTAEQTASLLARVDSLEEMRDEHQRQLLDLAGLFSQMQTTMGGMITTIGSQQRTISMLIDGYTGDHSAELATGDELAAKRDIPHPETDR